MRVLAVLLRRGTRQRFDCIGGLTGLELCQPEVETQLRRLGIAFERLT